MPVAVQAAATAAAASDPLSFPTWLAAVVGVITLVAVLVLFCIENWDQWWPFRLIETQMSAYPAAEEPRKVVPLVFNSAPTPALLVVVPRTGGEFVKFDVRFVRRRNWFQKWRRVDTKNPATHWISPDVATVSRVRIFYDGKEVQLSGDDSTFRLDKPMTWFGGEPIHFEITACIKKDGWRGDLTIRPAVERKRDDIIYADAQSATP